MWMIKFALPLYKTLTVIVKIIQNDFHSPLSIQVV